MSDSKATEKKKDKKADVASQDGGKPTNGAAPNGKGDSKMVDPAVRHVSPAIPVGDADAEPPIDLVAIGPADPPFGETPPDPRPVPKPNADGQFDLDDPNLMLNRELTWISFNYRVLALAEDRRTPLLERMNFISIVGSNLDEFFMKRIGGLKHQVVAGVVWPSADGRSPQEQVEEAYAMVRVLAARQRRVLEEVCDELREYGVAIRRLSSLDDAQREQLREHYINNIYPLVTPQATDPAHPFPFVSNLSLNLLVTLRLPDEEIPSIARVMAPIGPGIARFIRLDGTNEFVPIEAVMADNLDLLFPGMEILSCAFFRVTRNAETEIESDEADDLLAHIETELRHRRLAPIVRLEISAKMDPVHRGMLAAELGLDEAADVFEVDGMIGLRDVNEIGSLEIPELRYDPHHPVDNPAMATDRSIFHVIRDHKSLLVYHPYESFTSSVERFLAEASTDPKVRAVKMTVYRTSADSRAVDHLIEAARNGKQVAVVMELKARFDEAANIRWANRLSAYGIHVTYGVVGLKTHGKSILVVRQDYDGLRRYAHIGTGNYHAGTARLYSDVGLLTCDDAIGSDLTELFNYLTTGYKPKRDFQKLMPSPKILKPHVMEMIDRERGLVESGERGLIQIKINALEDPDVAKKLYEAAQAGVHIDLIVRDTCRIRPGIVGLSDNIRIISIVGRFLEHSRIYYFRNGGEDEYYIGSADIMRRNLSNRVEILAPVESPDLRKELRFVLDTQLGDRRLGWEMRPDGSYVRRGKPNSTSPGTHQRMIDWANERNRDATRLKRRRPRGLPS
ncbi:MAG: polyphosphate kinase 1 [Gemmatimonadota bacterium]